MFWFFIRRTLLTWTYYRARRWCSPKKKRKVIDHILDSFYVYKDRGKLLSCRSPLQIFFRVPHCSGFEASVHRDVTANEYLAGPFDFLWPTLFICVQNFTFFFMLETAQSVVVTAQRGLSNCAAAQARSLEGTLIAILRISTNHLIIFLQ